MWQHVTASSNYPLRIARCVEERAIRLQLTFPGCGRYRGWALGALAALLIAAGGEMVHARFRSPTRLPAWPEPKPGDRILIVAPHPDDEALAAGGLIQRAISRGARVRIVVLTDGDAFRVAAAAFAGRRNPRPSDYLRLGAVRERESLSAAAVLDVPAAQMTFLHYPDKGLAPLWLDRWDATHPYRSFYTRRDAVPAAAGRAPEPYDADDVLHDLRAVIREERPTAVYLPAEADEHPDHWATHLFAITALAQTRTLGRARIATYLIHHAGWPQWGLWQPTIEPPPGMRGGGWSSFRLTSREARRKEAAVERYRTQTVVLGRRLMRAFEVSNELFVPFRPEDVPLRGDRDGSVSPHAGPVLDLQADGGRIRASVPLAPPDARDDGVRVDVRLVGSGWIREWEFGKGAPLPPGCALVRGARRWEVSVPVGMSNPRPVALWVGAERLAPGAPVKSLGWQLFAVPGGRDQGQGE